MFFHEWSVSCAFGTDSNLIVEAQPDAERTAVLVLSDHGQIATSGIVPLPERAAGAGFAVGLKDALDGAEIVMTGGRNGEVRWREGASRGIVCEVRVPLLGSRT